MTTCPNCQKPVTAGSRFCADCGNPVRLYTPPAPASGLANTAPTKSPTWSELTAKLGHKPSLNEWQEAQVKTTGSKIGAAVLTVFLLAVGFGIFAKSCNPAKTDSSAATSSKIVKPQQIIRVGDSVTVGYWTYRANSVKWAKSVGPEFMRQTADADFMIVAMSVMNNDKTASTLPPLKLVDAEGRQFEESSAGMMLQNAFGPLKQVNPTVQSNGMVLFDVPRGKYWLEISGGMESGETSRIELP